MSDLEALSAARRMVIGGIGLLAGGLLVLFAAYDLGGPLPDAGVQNGLGIACAAVLAALGGVSFVGGLVAREEQRRAPDAFAIVLVTLVTMPLGMLAIGGWEHTHPPDKRVRSDSDSLPYTYAYPGTWKQDPQANARGFGGFSGVFVNVTGVGDMANPEAGQGAIVMTFGPPSREWLERWVRKSGARARTVNERTIRMAGREGIMVDYVGPSGKVVQSQAAVMQDGIAYVVTCFVELEPHEAIEGCRKVIDTFRFR